jgi:hypothetical protein
MTRLPTARRYPKIVPGISEAPWMIIGDLGAVTGSGFVA